MLTGFGGEEPFISALLGHFEARIADAAAFARANRVLLLRAPSGVGLDIALGGPPFEASIIARSTPFTYPPSTVLRTCSAEDLIVLKAFAGRAKDSMDVEGIIVRQTGTLDWDYIYSQLAPLAELKEAPEIVRELERRRAEFER